jgi:RNA polymerase sigma factor (TIGR02999 family)
MNEVTQILNAIDQGDLHAAEQLLPLVYAELRKLAAQRMAQERPGQTLQATALVHEAYLKLLGTSAVPRQWNSRSHFFAAAAEAMRRILIDSARRKQWVKHGGNHQRVDLDQNCSVGDAVSDDLLAVDDALAKLAAEEPVKAELVKLRYFAGLTLEQAAEVLQLSPATAKRYWTYTRAWLYQAITEEGPSEKI